MWRLGGILGHLGGCGGLPGPHPGTPGKCLGADGDLGRWCVFSGPAPVKGGGLLEDSNNFARQHVPGCTVADDKQI